MYVAQFLPDGSGQWIELAFGINGITAANPAYPFADQADVLVNARLAADAAGATKMDRPEWAAVHPRNGEVYFTLTNNAAAQRPIAAVDAANPRFYNDKQTTGQDQKGNPNGHIIRWAEGGGYADALSFNWDVYLFGARASAVARQRQPLRPDRRQRFLQPRRPVVQLCDPGLLWIQTDDGAYTDVTNCMMLAAVPGSTGDGEAQHDHQRRWRRHLDRDDLRRQATAARRKCAASWSGRRNARSPASPRRPTARRCSSTSSIRAKRPRRTSPPARSAATGRMAGVARPRSATIVITRDDGGVIGVD